MSAKCRILSNKQPKLKQVTDITFLKKVASDDMG